MLHFASFIALDNRAAGSVKWHVHTSHPSKKIALGFFLAKYAYYNSPFALLAIQSFLSDFIEKMTSNMSFWKMWTSPRGATRIRQDGKLCNN